MAMRTAGYAVVRPGIDWAGGLFVSRHETQADAIAALAGDSRLSAMVLSLRDGQSIPRSGDTVRLCVATLEGIGATWEASPLY